MAKPMRCDYYDEIEQDTYGTLTTECCGNCSRWKDERCSIHDTLVKDEEEDSHASNP